MKTLLVTTLSLVLIPSAASAQLLYTPTSTLKKGIVPVVGSTTGANGASFKTSLHIAAVPGAHGRIFLPTFCTIPRDDHPSIPYSIAANVHASRGFLPFVDRVARAS